MTAGPGRSTRLPTQFHPLRSSAGGCGCLGALFARACMCRRVSWSSLTWRLNDFRAVSAPGSRRARGVSLVSVVLFPLPLLFSLPLPWVPSCLSSVAVIVWASFVPSRLPTTILIVRSPTTTTTATSATTATMPPMPPLSMSVDSSARRDLAGAAGTILNPNLPPRRMRCLVGRSRLGRWVTFALGRLKSVC